ncbi:MAG TPA: YlbF family regulator [Clostridia bacterium]|nr:YlbF family regulator [Clostridia bacterium]HPQ47040.1 YlbF family regulator [Clostridia bacterium]HRX42615.1 YlbF family regulator [Clostridia bacterium]
MDVIEKARELAAAILATEEYLNMTAAEEIMNNDEEGTGLMQDMELLQQEYIKSAREGAGKEELAELEQYLKEKHDELMAYPATGDYIRAKAGFDRLIKKINSEITSGITGCSGEDCDGCSGCG